MRFRFDKLEARLQSLIEGSLARLFPAARQRNDLGSRLVAAMQANGKQDAAGTLWAPNLFTLLLPSEQAGALRENWALLDELSQLLMQAGSEAGLRFPSPPAIKVSADPHLDHQQVRILAQFNLDDLEDTSTIESLAFDESGSLPPNAFLIVDGQEAYPLVQSVINIGRSHENDLVVEDPRISRSHAQLRALHGRFLIFDLESTGGTYVNGERIAQAILHPGDVITLAGLPLIYGQDSPSQHGETQEYPVTPDPGTE